MDYIAVGLACLLFFVVVNLISPSHYPGDRS